MRNVRTWCLALICISAATLGTMYLPIISIPNDLVVTLLTVTSILFGLLASFFISELWTRYVELRAAMGSYSGAMEALILSYPLLSKNNAFKIKFREALYHYVIAILASPLSAVYRAEPYFNRLYSVLKIVKVYDNKDAVIFDDMTDYLRDAGETISSTDTLCKEKLFVVEWVILGVLSVCIIASVFLLRTGSIFTVLMAIVFSMVVILALKIIYDLNELRGTSEKILLEPDERLLDLLGKHRFYDSIMLSNYRLDIPAEIKYITEKNLKGELKRIYKEVNPDLEL